ncbi:STAS domain-containing protein [Paenibacillus silviterrae]|uniref:STAS domain-containing protein n=1 Tax=Paenibacillus silviterrae TaxID=3242194 RepID=UPI002542A14E|nr:STAS domain-containing protein [Paenibacillus chinjuensis]
MESSFQVLYRKLEKAIALDLHGDLTKQAEELLLQPRWEEGLESGRRFLVINFTETVYINSSGIALLIRIVRAGRKAGFETFAFGVTPHYQKLFRMVGLTEYMMIYPDEYSILARIEEE